MFNYYDNTTWLNRSKNVTFAFGISFEGNIKKLFKTIVIKKRLTICIK